VHHCSSQTPMFPCHCIWRFHNCSRVKVQVTTLDANTRAEDRQWVGVYMCVLSRCQGQSSQVRVRAMYVRTVRLHIAASLLVHRAGAGCGGDGAHGAATVDLYCELL
jgi:hypothetical protein